MNVIEAMEARHSVRSYQNKPIEEEKRKALEELARKCNAESGLNIQLCFDEEEAFQGMMAQCGHLFIYIHGVPSLQLTVPYYTWFSSKNAHRERKQRQMISIL